MSDIIGSTYQIIKKLGSGGGGDVYLANHLRLGKKVVLKANKRKLTDTKKPTQPRREADVLKGLSHPYIPQVYDYFVEGDTIYTVIDYIEGKSLDKPLNRGEHFSQPQVIFWAKQLLEALSYLHSPTHGSPPMGYVHRDIKPANIMLRPNGDICLIDFNIAYSLEEEFARGKSAGYASPEHYGFDFSAYPEKSGTFPSSTHTNSSSVSSRRLKWTGMAEPTEIETGAGSQTLSESATGTEIETGSVTQAETETETEIETGTTSQMLSETEDETGTTSEMLSVTEDETETAPASENATEDYAGKDSSGSRGSYESYSSSGSRRRSVPDVRSDIYMVGATLYHLLSGRRPAKDARAVIPLSPQEFSPQIVAIITKAMQPNPNLRYQTADEMLSAFRHLRENDSRVKRLKRQNTVVYTLLSICFVLSVASAFVGLKRMQTTEQWLKLAEYSQDALADGDTAAALDYALQALPTGTSLLQPGKTAEAQRALASAAGVYDLADGYKTYETIELPSEPLNLTLSPEGGTAACLYTQNLAVVDTETCETLATLPTVDSALAVAVYLDEDTLLYAGADGLTAYSISAGTPLWTGEPATGIALSADGSRVAAVYRDETFATVYNAADGSVQCTVDFQGNCQRVMTTDIFLNSNDNLLALNQDGTLLAVSFEDGSLKIFSLTDEGTITTLLDAGSGYTHFEGGFCQQYLAFSASNSTASVFAIVDTDTMEQTGGFQTSDSAYSVQTDESGVYVQQDNILVKIDPATGDQAALVTTKENILAFGTDGSHTVIATASGFSFFDGNAAQMSGYESDVSGDFLLLADDTALVGSQNSTAIRVLKYENHGEAELFSYDSSYEHSEARVSADGSTLMLFSYDQFRLYSQDGTMIVEADVPDAEQVYDQQYIRDEDGDRLEVSYYDGTVAAYSALDGSLLWEEQGEAPDGTLEETFDTEQYHIVAPAHGAAQVYSLESGKLLYELEEDAYVTYIYQAGDYLVVMYVTTDETSYAQLLNEQCEVLADLPYLCDVQGETLYFDYPSGNVRTSRIYDIEQLTQYAQDLKGELVND